MLRPKTTRVLTAAAPHSQEAISEWDAGITDFLEWANRARKGETSLPAAVQANAILMAFWQGSTRVQFSGLSLWAVCAACVRATKKQQKVVERQTQRELDRGAVRRAHSERTF